jgi:transposase-like protein
VGTFPEETGHRQVKYLNNTLEADHAKLKLLIRRMRDVKTLKTARTTIKSFEVVGALRKGKPDSSTSCATSVAMRAWLNVLLVSALCGERSRTACR